MRTAPETGRVVIENHMQRGLLVILSQMTCPINLSKVVELSITFDIEGRGKVWQRNSRIHGTDRWSVQSPELYEPLKCVQPLSFRGRMGDKPPDVPTARKSARGATGDAKEIAVAPLSISAWP